MDDKVSTQNSPIPSGMNLQAELAHVAEEMYKKNAELAERNKTLSLLRMIDEIILSTVTDIHQIAQQVADIVGLEEEFRVAIILLYDNKESVLKRLAVTRTERTKKVEQDLGHPLYPDVMRINSPSDSLAAQCVLSKQKQSSNNLVAFISRAYSEEEEKKIKKGLEIASVRGYPLIVRNEVIGAMIIGMIEEEAVLSPFRTDLLDRLAGVVGIAVDNALLYERIGEANTRLKELDKLKDEFVSIASHELRTPMTVIKSYLWLLMQGKRGPLNEAQQKDLTKAFASTERLINLVNDMLNISRIESGRLTVTIQNVNMKDLVESTISELMPRAGEQGLQLTTLFEGDNLVAKADPERVKQILINLVGNSLKFTPQGGSIQTKVYILENMVITQVTDTGKGINKEDMPKLFQKFGIVGSDYLTKQGVQGTGLGLYLTRSLIQIMQGQIWVESGGENKGSSFTFSLPKV